MHAAANFIDRIRTERPTVGLLAMDHVWPRLIELCQQAGLDYIILDREHGPHSDQLIAECCQIGRLIGFPVLVRTISSDYDQVRRAIDMGPVGIMLPAIERTEQLDEAREALWLPPRGRRRPGGWGNHGLPDVRYDTWRSHVEDHLVVLPQIETQLGLAQVEALAAHELTTAIAVGTYDLSLELGCGSGLDDAELQAALGRIRAAGRAVGKNMWMIGDGPTLRGLGYTLICVGDPSGILGARLAQIALTTKG